jgi:hypothetical protein
MLYGPNDYHDAYTLDELYAKADVIGERKDQELERELEKRDFAVTALVEMCQVLDEAGEVVVPREPSIRMAGGK